MKKLNLILIICIALFLAGCNEKYDDSLTSEYEGDEVRSSDNYQYFPSASVQSQAECQKSCYFEFLGTIEFRGYINR